MSNTLTRTAAALAMLAVAACSDAPVGPHGSTPIAAKGGPSATTAGVSGGVTVAGSFTIAGEGQWVILGFHTTPQPEAAGGICGDGTNGYDQGTWVKTTPGTTHVHELHVHCTIKEWQEESVTVTFSLDGNLVLAGNGNINLNFPDLCDLNGCVERKIHYRNSQDDTKGAGLLLGSGSDGSTWLLDLAQIDHAGSTRGDPNFDGISLRSYNGLTATKQGSSDSYDQVTLSW